MNNDNCERLVLENYENEIFYKRHKSNLNITFNRIAFIFFIFLIICAIYTIKVLNIQLLKFNYRMLFLMKAILFPGHGSQFVGMGSDFYEKFDFV
jgi:hypothetical protein